MNKQRKEEFKELFNQVNIESLEQYLGVLERVVINAKGDSIFLNLLAEYTEIFKWNAKTEENEDISININHKELNETILIIKEVKSEYYKNLFYEKVEMIKENRGFYHKWESNYCYWTRKEILYDVQLSEQDLDNLELIKKLWKADNAIGLATLLKFDNRLDDNFNNRRVRSGAYWIEKIGVKAKDYIEDEDKYYFHELIALKDLEKGMLPFTEVTNEKLLCLLADYFSINVLKNLEQDTLDMLHNETESEGDYLKREVAANEIIDFCLENEIKLPNLNVERDLDCCLSLVGSGITVHHFKEVKEKYPDKKLTYREYMIAILNDLITDDKVSDLYENLIKGGNS